MPTAIVECRQRFSHSCRRVIVPVDFLDEHGRVSIRTWEIGGRRKEMIIVFRIRARIEDRIAGREPAFHFGDFGRAHAEVLGDGLGLGVRQPGKAFLGLA